MTAGRATPEPDSVIDDADWYARDLNGYTAERTAFLRTDLTEATSDTGTVFTDCVFRDARFNAASFADAAFLNCTFTGCDFFAVKFSNCKLTGSTFERCKFAQLSVDGGDWSFVALPGADLRKVTLRGVRMREAEADLRGSDLSAFDPWSVDLQRAVIDWQQAISIAVNLGLEVRTDEA